MNIIKINIWDNVPQGYTGIAEYPNGSFEYYKNGVLHREDGPAFISPNTNDYWYLDGKCHWIYEATLDLTNQIVLSKSQHPEYPTVQVWKILNSDGLFEQIMIPGMEECIIE